jgi:hypothetical protein
MGHGHVHGEQDRASSEPWQEIFLRIFSHRRSGLEKYGL